MEGLPFLLFCYISVFSFFLEISFAIDTIALNQSISDGQTLVSSAQTFELGFFISPRSSNNQYLGIWYKNIPTRTVVWVANRNNPITDLSGVLSIGNDGNLVLLNQSKSVIWSSNSSKKVANTVAQLLDSGNFVLRDESSGNSESYLWQSFDYPCDTLIQGMKLGWNLKSGRNWNLSSWKSTDDPSTGDFTYSVDPRGLPQLVLRKESVIQYRSGPWDGVRFGGGPQLMRNYVFNPIFIFNMDDMYYTFVNNEKSTISRFMVTPLGSLQHLTWNDNRGEWIDIITLQKDSCDDYAVCGAYGTCNINDSPVCECLNGFIPKSPQEYNSLDWSAGCTRRSQFDCGLKEGFVRFKGLKLPDESHILVNKSMASREECELDCLANCSCMAYAKTDVSGCVVWYGELIDIREFSEGGQDLYIRMAASELDSSNKKKHTVMVVLISLVSAMVIVGSITLFIILRKREKRSRNRGIIINNQETQDIDESQEEDLELPLLDLNTIAAATDNFSSANKIGEGGFGPVYKGQLSTRQEIAVKRLSRDSGQGLKEFKNEVKLIAKLQHRNLVRLVGCCIQGEERMLIYEYMPNKSLDHFIFDQTRGTSLDWRMRFDIIVGIARGLLYLHQDSRLRIIHRDLKASNILLDREMNPKISDFGIARTFGANQTEANTKRVVGTYGYMSPEYAVDGLFSMKSDVFSFGVLVLEIVIGKKNRGFFHPDHELNLLGHAWKLWNEGKALELTDALMENAFPTFMSEVVRCIHVGLLCVQHRPEDRPTMSSVVLMLGSETAILPQPKQPGFYTERFLTANEQSSSTGNNTCTANEITDTMLQGR